MATEMVKMAEGLAFSPIVHGLMRIPAWGVDKKGLNALLKQDLEMGITTLDNADIYGNYTCEGRLGEAWGDEPSLRDRFTLITKCGIHILSDKHPEQKIQYYEYGKDYIIGQAERSLREMKTDRIDVLLLHRPSDLLNPEEVAEAFETLKREGKVRYFGVSNFVKEEYAMLQSYLVDELVTNQIELSPYRLDHFENMDVTFLMGRRVKPMAYCPMAGGRFAHPDPSDEKIMRLVPVMEEIAREVGAKGIDQIAYTWLMGHPAGIVPVNGSGNPEHLKRSMEARDIKLSPEQWQRILVAARGKRLP